MKRNITERLKDLERVSPGLARVVRFPFYCATFRIDDMLMEIRYLPGERSVNCPAFRYMQGHHPMFDILADQFTMMYGHPHTRVEKINLKPVTFGRILNRLRRLPPLTDNSQYSH